MQIMNLDRLAKDFWWNLTAFKTINELPDSVIFTNFRGEVIQFNRKAKEVFALSHEEFKSVAITSIIQNGMDVLQESVEKCKPVLCVATVPGREFYVELNAVKTFNGYSVSIRDLTKLTKELVNEEQTKLFNHEKNAMLAKLEGDLKSPITSISGFSRGLLDGLGGELTEKQTKYVKIINNNSEELYQFIDKFVQFSKAESSIYESDFHNFDVAEALKAVAKDYESLIEEKKLAFDIDCNKLEIRNIYSDAPSIKEAFRNILEVAISMTETGYISVRLEHPNEEYCLKNNLDPNKQNSYLKIVIKDTGVGISEDEMKYLCEPYAQLEKGKKNLLRAFKLGTASILIKRANGQINIFSEIMKGAKYTIILPIEKI